MASSLSSNTDDSTTTLSQQTSDGEKETHQVGKTLPRYDSFQAGTSDEQKDKPDQGGYDCSLVDPPPEHLQTECSVCLCLLRDPHLVDCCGYSFCQTCIESIKAKNKPCPLCNIPFSNVMPDKRLQRQLNGLQVYCSYKQAGCEWVGKLGALKDHLNTERQLDNRDLDGCKFALLLCEYCAKKFQRICIRQHEQEQCSRRPYSCDYCHDYASTCEDVTVNHWPVCGSRPIPCPNECGVYPEHKDLENHVSEKCPLQVVNCDFDYAGCEVKLPRKDMPDHISNDLPSHISMLAISTKRNQNELQENKLKIQTLEEELYQTKETLESIIFRGRPPILFKVENIPQYSCDSEQWLSPPFYSHYHGCKMRIGISFSTVTSGDAELKLPHNKINPEHVLLSLKLYLMCGEFDDKLRWPLQVTVSTKIFNELKDREKESQGVYHYQLKCDEQRLKDKSEELKHVMCSYLSAFTGEHLKCFSNDQMYLEVYKIEFKN